MGNALTGQLAQQHIDQHGTAKMDILVDCRQARQGQLGLRYIVIADNTHIFRHGDIALGQSPNGGHGHHIRGGKQAVKNQAAVYRACYGGKSLLGAKSDIQVQRLIR